MSPDFKPRDFLKSFFTYISNRFFSQIAKSGLKSHFGVYDVQCVDRFKFMYFAMWGASFFPIRTSNLLVSHNTSHDTPTVDPPPLLPHPHRAVPTPTPLLPTALTIRPPVYTPPPPPPPPLRLPCLLTKHDR